MTERGSGLVISRPVPSSPIPIIMRPARLKPVFLTALLFASSVSAQARLIRVGQIDSLQIPYSLSELTEVFRGKLSENEPDIIKRIFEVTLNYYNLEASRKMLALLSIEVSNLKAVWELNNKLANKGDITDLQLLASHNAYLEKRIALLSEEKAGRSYLLEIVRLSLIKIEFKDISHEKKKAHSDSH